MSKVITSELIKELRERTGVGLAKCKSALEEAHGDIEKAIEALRKAGIASAVKKESRETKEGRIEYLESKEGVALVEMNAETDFVVNNEKFHAFHRALVMKEAECKTTSPEELLLAKFPTGKQVDEERKELMAVLGENIVISRAQFLRAASDTSLGVYSHMKGKILVVVELQGSHNMSEFAREIAMHIAAESPDYIDRNDVPSDLLAKEEEIARSQVPGNKPKEIIDKIAQGKLEAFLNQVCLLRQKFIKNPDLTIAQLLEKKGKEEGKKLTVKSFLRWNVGS